MLVPIATEVASAVTPTPVELPDEDLSSAYTEAPPPIALVIFASVVDALAAPSSADFTNSSSCVSV